MATTHTHMTDEELLDHVENSDAGAGPDPVRSFGSNAAEQAVLATLAAAREGRDQADSDLVTAVAAARRADMSWAAIGAVLGTSKQGAQSFFADRI